jgi:apolipoprotein N-acyltransferase
MGPTRISTLVVAGLAAAAVAWLLISSLYYSGIPRLPWLPVVTLAALAVLEAYAAINTRGRIERKPGREPVNPLMVARFVVLAKASSLAGAIFAGFYGGLTGWLFVESTRAAADDRPAAGGGLLASLALVAAALWLERSCRVPERPDDEREPDQPESRPGQR